MESHQKTLWRRRLNAYIKPFISLLKEHGVYETFENNIKIRHGIRSLDDYYDRWPPYDWIGRAFAWVKFKYDDNGGIGEYSNSKWSELSRKWAKKSRFISTKFYKNDNANCVLGNSGRAIRDFYMDELG